MTNMSSIRTLSRFSIGSITVEYRLDSITDLVGLRIFPTSLFNKIVERREWLLEFEQLRMGDAAPNVRAAPVDSLVQVKCVGDDYPTGFSQGCSLRNSATTLGLKYVSQSVATVGSHTIVTTLLRDSKERAAEHRLSWNEGDSFAETSTVYRNESARPVTLELLSSFSLGEITPFHEADAPNRLVLHRLRSAWSAEGRPDSSTIEQLNLERSWQDHAVRCERFGQVGSLPVKGFFPFIAIEDIEAKVCWGAQLAWAGSWQMEAYRQSDALCFSGGLADREFGHWTKALAPGESFTTPSATVTCVIGDLDTLCGQLTAAQRKAADVHPSPEGDLPIVCNEFCTSWGNPTHDNIELLAKRLKGSPVRYLVIDAGWYGHPGSEWWNEQGTWQASTQRFPKGIAATAKMIRDHGLIPGLWFEMEVSGTGSTSFNLIDHHLKRDGVPITTTKRHFWDFRDAWVHEYLAEKVITQLREGNFGYAKFDYNESIGIGVDGAESLGEGLRQHIEGVYRFFQRIRSELPTLVIECCSSGGHRLEPSMIAHSAMSSFSDAHESLEIPIIAANLHRVMLPRQSQIWAVLRKDDDDDRLVYSLASTFLGRMCLSGDIHDLSPSQWTRAMEAMEFYAQVSPIIKNSRSRRFGPAVHSYRHPTGWQAVRMTNDTKAEALVVAHTFADSTLGEIKVPLPDGSNWRVTQTFFSPGNDAEVHSGNLHIDLKQSFTAAVVRLQKI